MIIELLSLIDCAVPGIDLSLNGGASSVIQTRHTRDFMYYEVK